VCVCVCDVPTRTCLQGYLSKNRMLMVLLYTCASIPVNVVVFSVF